MKAYQNQLDTITKAAAFLESASNEDAVLVLRASTTNERYRNDPAFTVARLRDIASREDTTQRFRFFKFSQRVLDVAGRL